MEAFLFDKTLQLVFFPRLFLELYLCHGTFFCIGNTKLMKLRVFLRYKEVKEAEENNY